MASEIDPIEAQAREPLPVITLDVQKADAYPSGPEDYIVVPTSFCNLCRECVDPDEYVARLDGEWVHVDCARKRINAASKRELMLTLASHVAHAPSQYHVGTVRTVIRNLLRIIAAQDAQLQKGNQ